MAKRPQRQELPKIGFFSSLRFKFAFTMAVFSALLMLGVIFILEQNFRESLVRENIEKGLGIARGVAFNADTTQRKLISSTRCQQPAIGTECGRYDGTGMLNRRTDRLTGLQVPQSGLSVQSAGDRQISGGTEGNCLNPLVINHSP